MAKYGWDAQVARVAMPTAGGTVNSDVFVIPRNSTAITLHIHTALAGAATVKLQALTPSYDVMAGTETWEDVKVFNLSAGTLQAISLAASSTGAITIPITGTGGGPMRLVASADQSGAPQTIHITIGAAH